MSDAEWAVEFTDDDGTVRHYEYRYEDAARGWFNGPHVVNYRNPRLVRREVIPAQHGEWRAVE